MGVVRSLRRGLSDYPTYFALGDILDWWNPDIPNMPVDVDRFDSLARFDYQDPVRTVGLCCHARRLAHAG